LGVGLGLELRIGCGSGWGLVMNLDGDLGLFGLGLLDMV